MPATDIAATMGYLARALKTPTIGRVWEQLATTARAEGWSHEEYLTAVLQRQVADREASGTSLRIAAEALQGGNFGVADAHRRQRVG